MPIYPYHCEKCDVTFDVVKYMSESGRPEFCNKCKNEGRRVYTAPMIIGASVESAEYNPALGCVVQNKKHREEIAKRKGLIEIGNEPVESIHKSYDKARAEKRKKAWRDI